MCPEPPRPSHNRLSPSGAVVLLHFVPTAPAVALFFRRYAANFWAGGTLFRTTTSCETDYLQLRLAGLLTTGL
jgi:hypothetical protein